MNRPTNRLVIRQIPLDREVLSSVTLVVLVSDSKLPPIFTATTTVSIEVLDENDNAPIFVNPPADPTVTVGSNSRGRGSTKAFTVMENAPRFTRLSEQLEARDPDQGDNGRVHFSLLDTYAFSRTNRFPNRLDYIDPDLDTSSLDETNLAKHSVDQPLFRITPDGGIETLVELDREAVPTYLLKIGVHDRGAQPLASTTMLRVDVLDANDNAPVWGFPTLTDRTINLTTGMKPGSLAGRLRADDEDAGDAGRVDFLFLGPRGEPLKAVSIEEGLLNSLALLTNPRVTNTVAEFAAKTTTTTSATVSPGSSQSRARNLSVQASRSRASRPEENGYRMGPLYLNGSTGEIWIAEPLNAGTINLHLRAQDRGKPHTQTDAWLTIHVFVDPNEDPSFFSLGGDGTLNITIILVMITITAIVSLFLIIGIVCVRRRPTRYMNSRGNAIPDGSVSPGHATLNYSVDPHKNGLGSAMTSTGWASPMSIYPGNHFIPTNVSMAGAGLLEDGQLYGPMSASPGMMGYGALVAGSSDTASLIYVPQPQTQAPPSVMSPLRGGSMTPVPVELSAAEYQSRGQPMHTFGVSWEVIIPCRFKGGRKWR
ncbi:Protocadherin 9 [Fasciola gigantica]|uniref:Protocadherin 9 n=1 Tax=Fasciola gigantica TaxID=46835 RepID=A0A504YX88_FASGI|nr:Protocadherin 9 [Fasciola gigantica]